MGGCYSAIKGTKKENGSIPEPQAAKDDIVPKVAELLPCKEETTLEASKTSKEETLPKEDITCEVSSPKKEATSEVVTLPKEEDVKVALPPKEEAITNEAVNVEASTKNDESCDVKETKKEKEEEEEIKDGEKVVIMDESKLTIEKMTLESEETGPKGEEAKAVAIKESEKECEAVEEQKTDKQAPVA